MWQQDKFFFIYVLAEYFSSYCLGLTLYKHAIYALFLYNNFYYERKNMNNIMMPIHFGLYLFNTFQSFH